jgi:hypothetical protein
MPFDWAPLFQLKQRTAQVRFDGCPASLPRAFTLVIHQLEASFGTNPAERAVSGMVRPRYKWVSVPVIFVWRSAQAKITLESGSKTTANRSSARTEGHN